MNALVSIIVPVYNAEKYLANTLDSIIRQSYKNFELLLINDGSTDKSKAICDKFALKDRRIKVLNKTNGGVSSARNYGLSVAEGEYVIFIDSDDYLTADMLETLVNDIESTKSDVAICGFWHVTEDEYKKICAGEKLHNKEKLEILDNPINYFYSKELMPYMWNKIFKRGILKKITFDETIHYGEDYLFCAKAFLQSTKACYREDKKYFYIKRADGLSMSEGSVEFWSGYARSKKILYDKFIEINASKELLEGIWKEYCIALIAVYRFIVHKRLKLEYDRVDNLYRNIIIEFIKESNLSITKKIEYLSFVISYNIAILCHKAK